MPRVRRDDDRPGEEWLTLTDAQEGLLQDFMAEAWVPAQEEGLLPRDLAALTTDDDRRLEGARFLVDRAWVLADAVRLFRKACSVRVGLGVDVATVPSPFPTVGYDWADVRAVALPHTAERERGYTDRVWHAMSCSYSAAVVGHDKQGRPVLYERTGLIDAPALAANLALVAPVSEPASHGAYELRVATNEVSRALVRYNDATVGRALGRQVTGCVYVFDLGGLGPGHLHRGCIDVLLRCFRADMLCPELVDKVVVLNTPALLSVLLSLLRPPANIKAKMVVISPADTARGALLEHIDRDQLPVELGGDLQGAFPPRPTTPHVAGDEPLAEFVELASRATTLREVALAKGDTARWAFSVADGRTIVVTATFTPAAPSAHHPVADAELCCGQHPAADTRAAADGSHDGPVADVIAVACGCEKEQEGEGRYTAPAAGTLHVTLSNEHSMFRGKTVKFQLRSVQQSS